MYLVILLLLSTRAVAARQSEASKPPVVATRSKPAMSPTDLSVNLKPKASVSKREKDKLKGVIVKKKTTAVMDKADAKPGGIVSDNFRGADTSSDREAKRRKTDGGE